MAVFFDFNSAIQQWQAIGIFDVMLPFILIFAIIFAILQKTKILSGRKGIDAIVAMAIGFIAIVNPYVSQLMKVLLENTVVAVLIIVAVMLLLGLVWGAKKPPVWNYLGAFIGLAVFVWVLGRVADYYQMYYPGTVIFSSIWWQGNLPWIIPLLIIVIFAIVVITSGGEKKAEAGTVGAKLLKDLFEPAQDW
jgi:hypothetical protein